jgi:hypothetical protein
MSALQWLRDEVENRAHGMCECTMAVCKHDTGRCRALLRGAWEVHPTHAGGAYTLSDVVGMCETCHRNTPDYGR